IKNLIKEQELTIQDNELALVRHEQGSLKWKVKCGATFAGALITSVGTAASIFIVTLINRQC
ncbi:MAG: hypothetical protein Q8Q33_02020, partial [Chlamydiota bacterium]|nr:hypothetical protein [Chlamydiota bacterium]